MVSSNAYEIGEEEDSAFGGGSKRAVIGMEFDAAELKCSSLFLKVQ